MNASCVRDNHFSLEGGSKASPQRKLISLTKLEIIMECPNKLRACIICFKWRQRLSFNLLTLTIPMIAGFSMTNEQPQMWFCNASSIIELTPRLENELSTKFAILPSARFPGIHMQLLCWCMSYLTYPIQQKEAAVILQLSSFAISL